MDTALVDGKYSTIVYLKALRQSWKTTGKMVVWLSTSSPASVTTCRLPRWPRRRIASWRSPTGVSMGEELLEQQIGSGLLYSRQIGNSYSAALYIGIASMLENDVEDLSGSISACSVMALVV